MYYAARLDDCKEIGIGVDGLVEEIGRPLGSRTLPAERILGEDARGVLDEWMKSTAYQQF